MISSNKLYEPILEGVDKDVNTLSFLKFLFLFLISILF